MSLTEIIPTVENPINSFRNQIIITQGRELKKETKILFKDRIRHSISFEYVEDLLKTIENCINPEVVNGIYCDLHTLAQIQHTLISRYPSVKFRFTNKFVTDVFSQDDQHEIVINEHYRAHRSVVENTRQVLRDYFFPNIRKKLKEIISNCKICRVAKYRRHPLKHKIAETPIPSAPGEILHVDIYNTDKKFFLTCLDKFSKFAIVKPILSRAMVDVKPAMIEILNFYKVTKTIVCDNEKSLNSETIKLLVKNNFGADIHATPPMHSTSNGQVERFHSTLTEIARCIKLEYAKEDTTELILMATAKYHSIIKQKPIDVIQSIPEDLKNDIRSKILEKQKSDLVYHNKKSVVKMYSPGEKVFVKINKRLGNKFNKVFEEKIVQEDLGTTLKIDNKIVHKDNVQFLVTAS